MQLTVSNMDNMVNVSESINLHTDITYASCTEISQNENNVMNKEIYKSTWNEINLRQMIIALYIKNKSHTKVILLDESIDETNPS